MNRFSINSAALNSGGNLASIVYLPDAFVTVQRELSERVSIRLIGISTKSLSVGGNISRVFAIGSVLADIGLDVEGSLTQNQRVYLNGVLLETGLDLSGLLAIRKLLSLSATSMTLSASGRMNPEVKLKGTTTVAHSLAARLHSVRFVGSNLVTSARNPNGTLQLTGGLQASLGSSIATQANLAVGKRSVIPVAAVAWTVTANGTLQGKLRLQGQSVKVVTVSSGLIKISFMSGTNTSQLRITGDLANNANTQDLEAILMFRKLTKREMAR